jgi:uncharacterized membrane protein
MTLFVDIPDLPTNLTQSELLDELYALYPQFESYVISFAVIAIFWVCYHQVFNPIKGSPIIMVYLNLIFLLLITLLSLATSLVINYDIYQISYVIYNFIVIMTSLLLALIWWYATKNRHLVEKFRFFGYKRCSYKSYIYSHSFYNINNYFICKFGYCSIFLVVNCSNKYNVKT